MHNRNALHVKLYQISGPRHVILRTQKMLAAELGMSQFTLNRIMSEMVDDRRIKIIGKGRSASKRYVVYDPRTYCEQHHDWTGAEYAHSILDPQDSPRVTSQTTGDAEDGAVEDGRGEDGASVDDDEENDEADLLPPLLPGNPLEPTDGR